MERGEFGRLVAQNPIARALLYPAILARRAMLQRQNSIYERVIGNLRDCLAEDPVLHLREYAGTFAVDRRSHIFARIASQGQYEPELAACCLRHLDRHRDAIDIGANVGFYANLMAKNLNANRVLAIEPTRNALLRLHENVVRNRMQSRIVIFEGVASDIEGELSINTIAGKEEYSSLGPMEHPSIRGQVHTSHSVTSATIDSLVKMHGLTPGFIKIDVEGAERRVLQGCLQTLHEHRPIVLSELTDSLLRTSGSSAEEVITFMEGQGYDVVDPFDTRARAGQRDFGDMLCLPRNA